MRCSQFACVKRFFVTNQHVHNLSSTLSDVLCLSGSVLSFSGLKLQICNDKLYGFVPVPLEDNSDPKNDHEQLLNIKLEALSKGVPLILNKYLSKYVTYPELWKFGCDEIFMINLERRKERRHLMEISLKELGMDFTYFKAVDGRYFFKLILFVACLTSGFPTFTVIMITGIRRVKLLK